MPVLPKKVNVIKVPRDTTTPTTLNDKVMPEFQRMPRMYLELLENKDKIKPNMVNKEYDPEDAASIYSFDLHRQAGHQEKENDLMDTIEERGSTDSSEIDESSSEGDEEGSKSVSTSGIHVNQRDEDDSDDVSSEKSGDSRLSFIPPREEHNFLPRESYSSENGSERSRSSRESSQRSISSKSSSRNHEEEMKKKTKEKLKSLLFSEGPQAPTLAELHKRGEVKNTKVIADLGRLEADKLEEEDELKRELLFKFELLKKSYKNVNIPEFTIHSDYKNMNQTYENTLRQVSLDSNVESYKSLLVGGFMLLEFILGFWLKFDMSGFTQQQILNMNQYERLLIELGEKSYVPGGSQWPVELRLLGLIVMNAIIFIISKMILKKTGSNLVGLMNSVNTIMTPTNQKPRRRMRGPTVDLESIPEMSADDE